jgi:hypothetical protein
MRNLNSGWSAFYRGSFGICLFLVLAGCGSDATPEPATPYSRFVDPPLVRATLHTVTLAGDTEALSQDLLRAGYTAADLPPNYPRADAVEAAIWDVPESAVSGARHFKAPRGGVDIRLVVTPPGAPASGQDRRTDQEFFRNVLGTTVPAWPLATPQPGNIRIQAWTYRVPSIQIASRRLRENRVPVTYNPVSITTSYLGTFKTLALRAPDGTAVQLVEATAQ